MPTQKNFEWYQGEDFTFDVFYAIDGIAQDMTNYAVRMDIAPMDSTGKTGPAVFTLNSEDVATGLDAPGAEDNEMTLDTNGKISVSISRSVTLNNLRLNDPQTVFGYDLFLRDKTTGKQRVLLTGTILVTRAVTHWE